MSDYNNDSNDDLPSDGKDSQAQKLTDDQYADAQTPQANYTDGQYEEEYSENVNSYYTNEYQTQDYYETPAEGQSQGQTEPVIFVNQNDEIYAEDDNIYSTELPNYRTNITLQHSEPTAYAEAAEYVAPNLNAAEALNNDEGYVAADEYLEPDIHAKSNYVEPLQSELGQAEPVLGGYVAETYSEGTPAEQAYTEPAPTEQTHLESGFAQPQYSESNFTEQEYAQPSYAEAAYEPQPLVEPAYEEPQVTAQSGYEPAQYASDEYATDQHTVGQDAVQSAVDRPNYDNVSHDEPSQLQAMGDAPVRNSGQQDFKQEYEAETSKGSHYIIGWAAAGLALTLLLGSSFYYLYTSFVSTESAGDVPVILADKSEIKTFPNADSELETTINGSKNTDRVENGAADVGQQGVTIIEPALLDSREDVVDEATKSEDRLETSDGVVADNDDKDIQNVLTLIKSGANNVEILLKPEDVDQLGQNQINIDGLETILVDAQPVKLNDLIAQANQLPQSTIERVAASNVDDLPVVDSNDPFKNVITANNAVATELPEATAQPLPETDLSNAIAIASNQITSNQAVNVVADAPKPVVRPTTAPTSVPNSLSPQVAAASGGAYGVQLASLPSEAGARQAYLEITAKFPNLLAGYNPIIREAIIPDKGRFYRVFAGPLVSYNDANQLCANLRTAGINGCFARKM